MNKNNIAGCSEIRHSAELEKSGGERNRNRLIGQALAEVRGKEATPSVWATRQPAVTETDFATEINLLHYVQTNWYELKRYGLF